MVHQPQPVHTQLPPPELPSPCTEATTTGTISLKQGPTLSGVSVDKSTICVDDEDGINITISGLQPGEISFNFIIDGVLVPGNLPVDVYGNTEMNTFDYGMQEAGPHSLVITSITLTNGCTANFSTNNSVSWTVYDTPTAVNSGPTTVDDGDAVNISLNGSVGANFSWINDNPAIGLGLSGNGNIVFNATNTGASPINATITVTPTIGTCVGDEVEFTITVNPGCVNPTNGGEIAGAQTICSGGDPIAFTSTSGASGNNGTIEYKWQSSVTGNLSGFSDNGATGLTYDVPAGLIQTTWYKRLARVDCASDGWNTAVASNVLEVTVNTVTAGVIEKGGVQGGPGCGTLDPGITAITTSASGTGIISYSWVQSTDGSNWLPAIGTPDAEGDQFNPAAFTVTTSFKRIATSTLNTVACFAESNVLTYVVNPYPVVAAISGGSSVCVGSALQLESTTPGGIWSSDDDGIATVSQTGLVTGISAGVLTTGIHYTVTNGFGCSTTRNKTVTVLALPTTPVAGNINTTYDGLPHTGTATFGANEEIVWYTNATGSTTTSAPTLTNTGSVSSWAEARNTLTGCVSAGRTEVTVADYSADNQRNCRCSNKSLRRNRSCFNLHFQSCINRSRCFHRRFDT